MKLTGTGAGGWAGRAGKFVVGGGLGIGGAGGLLLNMLKIFGRFAGLGVVIALAVKAFEMISDNAMGLRDYLSNLWDGLVDRVNAIAAAMQPLFDAFAPSGSVGSFFDNFVNVIVRSLGAAIEAIVAGTQMIVNMFSLVMAEPSKLLHPLELFKEAGRLTEEQTEQARLARINTAAWNAEMEDDARRRAARPTPTARGLQPNYDFRGSHFDIKQAFAEGFDPDRIAVAFANDLATLGETRIQSQHVYVPGAVR
jgi:hypothetical protein